ncbi:HPr kinase/phosphorylase [Aminobacter sp. HY435]|uniref:HPr kinase/phosphorylase n=1 Tax=Aminobacter sp. HY435 TaxID=2970917 RepID=UPI0022B98EF3|nr:HPr kinase/phosphorylase [Aminobacter sp. HY435]
MPSNLHATAIVLADRGVLIAGPSGSGKTLLALALVERVRGLGQFARLVSDDQVFLERHGGRLICRTPSTIAGLAELRGYGLAPMAHEGAAAVDLLVRLVPAKAVERLPLRKSETVAGCAVPCVMLAEREIAAAIPVVLASLGMQPFA